MCVCVCVCICLFAGVCDVCVSVCLSDGASVFVCSCICECLRIVMYRTNVYVCVCVKYHTLFPWNMGMRDNRKGPHTSSSSSALVITG